VTSATGVTAAQRGDDGAVAEYEIRHHYNVPTEFYRLWLDPSLTYSCALWADGDTLATAQQRKLDHLLTAAGAPGTERLLDIGCGWGSLMRRAVDSHGVAGAVGLTVSASQAAWIRSTTDDRIEVRTESYLDHEPAEPYDAIVSIGAIEHFALRRSTRDVRLDVYRDYFRRCRAMLKPGSSMSLQTVCKAGGRLDREAVEDFRVIDEVFPDSAIMWPSEILQGAEGTFSVESVLVHGDDYARTCRAWERTLCERHDEAVAIVGEDTTGLWERYLGASARRFEQGHATLLRLGFRRLD
jgi:cyclopropane-fatty-acyl-phospholipid synthase